MSIGMQPIDWFFLSVDINHLPFTINQFFLMVFIYLWDITVYWYLRLICVDDPNYTVFRHWNDGHWILGIPKWRDFPAIFRLVNCSLTRIYADVLSYFTTQARPSNYSALAEVE